MPRPRSRERHHGRRRSSPKACRVRSPISRRSEWMSSFNDRERAFFADFLKRYPNVSRRIGFSSYTLEDVNNDDEKAVVREAPKPDPVRTLIVKNVDLNIQSNGAKHHTDEYDISSMDKAKPKLVVRRGQPFNIDVRFSKKYDPKTDDLRLVFEVGNEPIESKGTKVSFILSAEDKKNEWGAKILKSEGENVTITIFTPPDLMVGVWTFKMDVVKSDNTDVNIYRYVHKDKIYMIFNPWCKDDTVYFGDENLLKEYILNESGKIYVGNKYSISGRAWNFGQFESVVLDVAIRLIENSNLKPHMWGSPIQVSRILTGAINNSAEDMTIGQTGVLTGNWSGDYSGGDSPLSWTGSVAILEKFWEDWCSVNYGQCWVFSGVTTTILRALGIPTRSVTNFASAHDTDGSITIDNYNDMEGNKVNVDGSSDSVWNFHVWNEAWMARPDLPIGYGGWQALDATPQEASDGGFYFCGPASVAALKQGQVCLPYDSSFIFAEVNADRVYWRCDETNNMTVYHVDEKCVGKNISTKEPNGPNRQDVTSGYKPAEGSAEERACVLKANQLGSCKKHIYDIAAKDVEFSIQQDAENTWVGEPFVVTLKLSNKSKEQRTIAGKTVVKTMFYTGVTAEKVLQDDYKVVLKPGETNEKQFKVNADSYESFLKDCCMLDVSIWATVRETNQCFVSKDDSRLRKPHLTVKPAGPLTWVKGKEYSIDVSFRNPLDSTLTNCFLQVDGLAKILKFPQRNLPAKGTLNCSIPVIPQKLGQKELILVFNSKQLEDINTSVPVFIKEA